jgi:serine/threonine-protein kinase
LAPEPDLTGRTIDDFRVVRKLGQGGMGQVYLAEQLSLKRKVALKILKADLAAHPASLVRFKAEAEAVARATHANIVQVYAVGEANGLHYMALEYVEGLTLREYVARKGSLCALPALNIMRQVAAALQRAGELGIIHRDIKPENILLSRKGEVKVADFGLSRCLDPEPGAQNLTQSGVTLGTPLYMSPEQVEGKPLDPRTDVYSFGVTCYQMLAGTPPFRGQSAFEVALQHVRDEPEPLQRTRPDLPTELCAAVHKMMAKRPDDRYQTGGELLRDLNRVREGLSRQHASATGALSLTPFRSPADVKTVAVPSSGRGAASAACRKRWRWPLAVAALSILVALLAGVVVGWRQGRPAALPGGTDLVAADDNPSAEVSPIKKREQFLLAAVQEYAHPRDASQTVMGVEHCLELAVFYLDQWRLDDADRFFRGLTGQPYRAYQTVGRLGRAVVLAFQDQPGDSNRLFLDVVGDRSQPAVRTRNLVNRNPRFVRLITRAVERNAVNCEALQQPFPPALQDLRKPRPLYGSTAAAPGKRG